MADLDYADAEKHAEVGFPIVFDRWSEDELTAGTRVRLDTRRIRHAGGIQGVIAGYGSVAFEVVFDIERQHQLRVRLYSQAASA